VQRTEVKLLLSEFRIIKNLNVETLSFPRALLLLLLLLLCMCECGLSEKEAGRRCQVLLILSRISCFYFYDFYSNCSSSLSFLALFYCFHNFLVSKRESESGTPASPSTS
jgi:hypothetical protein